ncbi:Ig-like domain-containing protein [Roseiflexus sp.]
MHRLMTVASLLIIVTLLASFVTPAPPPASAASPSALFTQSASSAPLDIMLLQDETGSMGDDIASLRRLVPEIWDGIDNLTTAQFRMGVAGFRDYSRRTWGSYGDWVYRLLGSPTSNRAEFESMLNALTASSGYDWPEGSLPAIKYMFTPGHDCIDSNGNGSCTDSFDTPAGLQPTFRTGARRVLLLATDAPPHRPERTPGYPGPSLTEVIDLLRRARVVVIGLVPGGSGQIPEVDELARSTGGSVQDTGASGADVATAIIAALGDLLPVSPSLSTITLSSTNLLADGTSAAEVRVTLRDTAGRPVPGRTVMITSTRGVFDLIEQPIQPTNANGVTIGTIRSTEPGETRIGAIDISSNVPLATQASIRFTPANLNLRNHIVTTNRITRNYLNVVEAALRSAGDDGDYFVGAVTADAARLATGVFLSSSSIFAGVKQTADVARPTVYLAYPGTLSDEGWSAVLRLREAFPRTGAFFDDAVRQGVRTNNWSEIALKVPKGGMRHYAAQLFIEVAVAKGLETAERLLAEQTSRRAGMPQVASYGAQTIDNLETMTQIERERILGILPLLSDAEADAYITDLGQRSQAAIVIGAAYERQALLLDSLRGAHETVGNDGLMGVLLRFTTKTMAEVAFPAYGSVAIEGILGAFDTYINSRKLSESGRGVVLAQSLLKGAPEIGVRIYGNTVGGYSRIENRQPPTPLTVRVASITNYSQGHGIGPVWFEENSFSDIVLVNDSDVAVDLEVFADYGYTSRIFFGIFPYAYMPMVETQVVSVPARSTRTMRIMFRQGAQGGSPAENSPVHFSVLASVPSENSLRFVATGNTIWQNVKRMNRDGSLVSALPMGEAQQIVENPISSYVLADPVSQTYEAQLWLSNPFSMPIVADIHQTLPAGSTIVGTDGNVDGSTVRWSRTIAASDLVSATVRFRLETTPGAELRLQPAIMSFQEPTSGLFMTTESNSPNFTAMWPVSLDFIIPRGQTGVTSTLALSLTNHLTIPLSGTIEVRLTKPRGGELVSSRVFVIDGATTSEVTVPLPMVLLPGTYAASIIIQMPNATPIVRQGLYDVVGEKLAPDLEQIYLPMIHR